MSPRCTGLPGNRPRYPFDNSAPEAVDRFTGLSALYDPVTARHLDRLGIAPGWRCLEIGAGGGSVALHMSSRVGERGHVLATDIDTSRMPADLPANVAVCRHDIGTDALPAMSYDLAHARAVLPFVADHDAVLARLIEALTPGGWLLVEDLVAPETETFDPEDPGDADIVRKWRHAVVTMSRRRGAEPTAIRALPSRLTAAGLVEIGAEGYFAPLRTAAVVQLGRATIDHVGDQLTGAGLLTPTELARYRTILERPDGRYPGSLQLVSVWGRRPLA